MQKKLQLEICRKKHGNVEKRTERNKLFTEAFLQSVGVMVKGIVIAAGGLGFDSRAGQ